jgi:hypothetical protein
MQKGAFNEGLRKRKEHTKYTLFARNQSCAAKAVPILFVVKAKKHMPLKKCCFETLPIKIAAGYICPPDAALLFPSGKATSSAS